MLNITQSLKLLEECHSCLERAAVEIKSEWNPDDVPFTLLSASLAKALVSSASELVDSELKAISNCIEGLLTHGDEPTKDVIATGFLEAIVAAIDENRHGTVRVMDFLGPLAKEYCREWKSFTDEE